MAERASRYLQFVTFTPYEERLINSILAMSSEQIRRSARQLGGRSHLLTEAVLQYALEPYRKTARGVPVDRVLVDDLWTYPAPLCQVEVGGRVLRDPSLAVAHVEHVAVAHPRIHDRDAEANRAAIRHLAGVTAYMMEAQRVTQFVREYGAQLQVTLRAPRVDLHERSSGRPAARSVLAVEAAVECASDHRGGPFSAEHEVRPPRLQAGQRSGQLFGLVPPPRRN
jgi:hypothetical protein